MREKNPTTKEKILKKSLELFNERGCSNTSLRKIAAELSISDGNLRYHFRTKEDLILELFEELNFQGIDSMMRYKDQKLKSMNNVREVFIEGYTMIYAYKFFFLESVYLLKNHPRFRIQFFQMQQVRKAFFVQQFDAMKKKGILSDQFSDKDYEMLFEHIFVFTENWVQYLEFSEKKHERLRDSIEHYVDICLNLVVPYLVRK